MTALTIATRAEAIAAAVDKFLGADTLPDWDGPHAESEYMRGICEVLADTFGTDDPENARSEIWEEMRIAFEHDKRRATAERITSAILEDESLGTWRERLDAAALAGMEAAR